MQTMQLVNEYLAACQANGASPGTISNKQSTLGRFAQANPEFPLQPEPIFQFLATLGKSMATRTQGRKQIRAFYTFACKKHDLIDPMPQVSVPLRAAKGPRRPRQSSAQVLHMGGGAQNRSSNPQSIACPSCGAPIYFGGNRGLLHQSQKMEGSDR